MSRGTFFDMTKAGIIRYGKNNEERSVSKSILSGCYSTSVPFKCHLRSVLLFVAKHRTFSLFSSKVPEGTCALCVELWQVAPELNLLKICALRSPNGAHQGSSDTPWELTEHAPWKCQGSVRFNNVAAHKKTSVSIAFHCSKCNKGSPRFSFPKDLLSVVHRSSFLCGRLLNAMT